MNSNDLDDFFNGLPNNPLLQQAPDSNVVQLRVALLEERFDALESKVTQICNMLENQHNNNVNVASSSTTTTTTTSSNINDSPPAQQENQQVFSMVNKKKKCNKCSLQGDVRTEHLVSPTHLAAVRDRSGRPLYWCKGECGLTKSRNVDNINAVLLERPAHVAAKMSKTIADEDHGNRWCCVCGGAFVLDAPAAPSKKRKEGDVAMALRVSPEIERFTPGLYYVDDDLVVHSSLPLASKFVTPVISPAPQRVSGHPKHFDESRHTFGVTHLPVTESGLVDCFAILSRERFDELGGTPASVLHALKEGELSLFGGRDDGFVTLRQREPAYITAFGPAMQFPIDGSRFVVMSVHELHDDAERCLPSVADKPMPLGDNVAEMFAALPPHWPPLRFDADEADDVPPADDASDDDDDNGDRIEPAPPQAPQTPPPNLCVDDVVKFQLLVLVTSWEHVENPNRGIFVTCASGGFFVRSLFWRHPGRRRLLIDAMRLRVGSASAPRPPADAANAIAKVLAILCRNDDAAGIDSMLAMSSEEVLGDIVWLDWERALGEALVGGHVSVAIKLMQAFRTLQPSERVVSALWSCAAVAIEHDEFAQIEPWLVEFQWQCPFPKSDFRRAALVLAACRHGRVAALRALLTGAHADEQWTILTTCDGPVRAPIQEVMVRGHVDLLTVLCELPSIDFAGIVKSGKYPWFASSSITVKWLFDRDWMLRDFVPSAVHAAIGERDSAMLVRLLAMCDVDLLRGELHHVDVAGHVLQFAIDHEDEAVFRALVASRELLDFVCGGDSYGRVRLMKACLFFNDVGLFERLPRCESFEKCPNPHMLANMMARGSLDAVEFAVHKLWKLDVSFVLVESVLTHPHPRLFEMVSRIESPKMWQNVLCKILNSDTGSVPNRASLVDAVLQKYAAHCDVRAMAACVSSMLERRQFVVADAVINRMPDVVRQIRDRLVLPSNWDATICCCPSAIPLVQALGPRETFPGQFEQFGGFLLARLVGEHLTPATLDKLLDTVTFFDPANDPEFWIALVRHSPQFDAQIERLLAQATKVRVVREYGPAMVREAAKLGNQRLVDRLRAHPQCPQLTLIHEDDE